MWAERRISERAWSKRWISADVQAWQFTPRITERHLYRSYFQYAPVTSSYGPVCSFRHSVCAIYLLSLWTVEDPPTHTPRPLADERKCPEHNLSTTNPVQLPVAGPGPSQTPDFAGNFYCLPSPTLMEKREGFSFCLHPVPTSNGVKLFIGIYVCLFNNAVSSSGSVQ